MDANARQSIIDRISQANNVLVTVKSSPSVDSLAACIGMTLFLNKLGKHGTAVFSGDIPSTVEFLKPEETIEENTDSLRDFIISLDKSKADKLRYKVEDEVVKIFITPYKTSITDKDLDFSQGDFNVDVILAIGVHAKEDLDQAIVSHGRILHDATIISINNGPGGSLGTLHLEDPQASSLSEMLVSIAEGLKPDSFDAQIATAFLTGIVAETERFSNKKTTPQTMSLSAKLMAAGANQQLIATQLQSHQVAGSLTKKKPAETEDGTLEIEHDSSSDQPDKTTDQSLKDETAELELPDIEASSDSSESESSLAGTARPSPTSEVGPIAPTSPEPSDTQAQSVTGSSTMEHKAATINPDVTKQELHDSTISSLEEKVHSPHADGSQPDLGAQNTDSLDQARKAVESASGDSTALPPLERTGASFLDAGVNEPPASPQPDLMATAQTPPQAPPVAPVTSNSNAVDLLMGTPQPPQPPANSQLEQPSEPGGHMPGVPGNGAPLQMPTPKAPDSWQAPAPVQDVAPPPAPINPAPPAMGGNSAPMPGPMPPSPNTMQPDVGAPGTPPPPVPPPFLPPTNQ